MPPGSPLYDRLLEVEEVRGRIERCWKPYHRAVETALDDVHRRFGKVWHVNCHSMPPRGNAASEDGPVGPPHSHPGDRAGPTREPAFSALVPGHLPAPGHSVTPHDPKPTRDVKGKECT